MRSRIIIGMLLIPVLAGISFAQKSSPDPAKTPVPANPVRFTPAYAEVLLKRAELESEVESLLIEYTEEYPKIKESRFQLSVILKEMDRLLAVKPADVAKLTLALGKMMVRKSEVETDLWALRLRYSEEHPDVKRAKRKLEIFDAAIKEILG